MTTNSSQIISTGYSPRKHQYDLHLALKRFSVVICHRRFGKTYFALNHLIDYILTCKKPNPRGAYIAPTYSQAKRVAWDYIKQFTRDIPGVVYNEAELRVDFPLQNNGRIQLLSGENYVSLKGIYLDIAVLDEFGDMNPSVWREAVRPTLSDRKGKAIFIGTVKGQNHFWEMYEYARSKDDPEWYAAMFKASETGIIDQSELASARRQMTEEEYNQEYECDPNAGLVGAYFAKELSAAEREGRITTILHDPTIQVDTYWDLGVNDMTSIWFCQSRHNMHNFIDYYELSGGSIPALLAEIKKRGYNFGEFVLPHDAKVRDYSTGRTRIETFYSLGVRRVRVIPKVGNKMESINATRMAFPLCRFDRVKCAQGLKALANYQRKWDAKNNVFQDTPLHNWASNGSDAFQQFGLGLKANSGTSDARFYDGSRGIEVVTDYDPYEI